MSRNFQKIIGGIDPQVFLKEINDDDWLISDRHKKIPVQRNTNAIFLRGGIPIDGVSMNDVQDSVDTELAKNYTLLLNFLSNVAVCPALGILSRVMIARLAPGLMVYPHIDYGDYYLKRDRYHLVLDSDGSEMTVAGETSIWKTGELWWFNNRVTHSATNLSKEKWRIHAIFDVLPISGKTRELSP